MTESTLNSRNPANSGSLAGTFREVLGKFLSGVDDMLPAVVIEYDRTTNRVKVRPVVRILKTDNTLLDRAELASIPVLNIGGGNAVLSFNILPGDLGWIKANDRDISLFLQSSLDAAPNTLRKHSFSDALFIPDQFRKWTLNAEDDAFAVLQTLDGTQRIAIHDTQVKITSDATVVIDAPETTVSGNLTVSGNATIEGNATVETDLFALGDATVTGNATIETDLFAEGDATVSVNLQVNGTTTSIGDVVGAGKSVSLHGHTQGPDSAGDTQVPVSLPT